MNKKSKSRKRKYLWLLLLFPLFIFLNNSNLFVSVPEASPVLLAHRAMGQPYDREGLTNETCTAEKWIAVEHQYLENTIPSIEAAFAAGAQIVEFDVHKTTDDRFGVFHDWTVDCRTEGRGRTKDHSLDSLQKLDIGYGYTADGGKTFPFRGKGVGMMPSLEQILTSFPDKDFMIDVKSNLKEEGKVLGESLKELSQRRSGKLMVYGGRKSVEEVIKFLPDIQYTTRPKLKSCLTKYFAYGWTGIVPAECQDCVVMVPENFAPWLWGWPHKFVNRMESVNSRVMLVGPYKGEGFSTGFDKREDALELPENYRGGIWTDRIDLLGPAFGKK
ncbi:MAG: glycerophosphodiester phosphodiesterase family protein [Bacteroidia bacterium]|nr:glycerophosphodiester phosphodiesterase family protein [Bacteroidia bacterium]